MTSIVLLSGGLDSAVLAAHEAQSARVLPVYVSVGLAWEDAEVAMVSELLGAKVFANRTEPLMRVEFTMRDIYPPTHWAIRGVPPGYDTPDEDVYLTGRNLVLLTKAGVVAARHGAHRIALGPLAGNPFPDARPQFFTAMAQAMSLGLDHQVEIAAPFLHSEKSDVIKRGVELGVPLELTLSCMSPLRTNGRPQHCGLCSKCRERRDAFAAAGVSDPSTYANRPPR
ncbi:MAG TPA: 7-cyano-7-deazaguanine synthase [Vicinamibacterales bacterium]|nr:7-cyano-7-deazaguanine synthase [Vicinamibacterales bacterium]